MFGIVTPIVLIGMGMAIRLDAFLLRYCLSTDEAALAHNIINRPWTALLRPLDYAQIAPPGYLLIEKGLISLFGSGEFALRALPFVCGLASLCLSWMIARRVLSSVGAVFLLGLVAASNALAQHAAVAKPYSVDVAAALLILFWAVKVLEHGVSRRRAIWIGGAGALLPLFSFASVFVLAGGALACWWLTRRDEDEQRRCGLIISSCWLLGAAAGTIVGHLLLTPRDAAFMKWFWAPGFMPIPPNSLDDALWIFGQLQKTFRWTGQYRASIGWIVLATIGLWSFAYRRPRGIGVVLTAPLVLVVGASVFRLYPFIFGRLELFLLPPLLILVVEGADWLRRRLSPRVGWVSAVPLMTIAVLAAFALVTEFRARGNGDLRRSMSLIREHWQPGDRAYVHYQSAQVFAYYAPRLGFAPSDYVIGSCQDGSATALHDIETWRGRSRVWVVALGEEQTGLLARRLNEIGTVRESHLVSGAETDVSDGDRGFVALYDLTTPSAAVSAETLAAMTAPHPNDPGWTCYGPFSPITAASHASN
jgi:hypothetical protein